MIAVRGVKKSFGNLEVLKGIDLDIGEAEIVGIVGESGAGKTTLLQIMGSLDAPSAGTVNIKGEDIHRLKGDRLAGFRNRHIGFIFQFHQLLPEFTALENVCLPGWIAGKSKKTVANDAAELLNLLGLTHRLDHKPGELSGGEQQRVAVARALINKPSVVFADEPSGNLDSRNAGELHQYFVKLRDELRQTFVIVTHNAALAEMGDRIVRMQDGLVSRIESRHE
jgi:lipoprotein-releasing system ATP-binding protein